LPCAVISIAGTCWDGSALSGIHRPEWPKLPVPVGLSTIPKNRGALASHSVSRRAKRPGLRLPSSALGKGSVPLGPNTGAYWSD
jgi:hypothetical protein